MIFSLDVMRARKGDCLIVHYGTQAKPGLIMIDGGPSQVYEPFLRPRLQQIRDARRLTNKQTLRVDLAMVSHIDDDHIKGILDLMQELSEQNNEDKPLLLKPRSFWHNAFDNIIGNSPEELKKAVTAQFGAAAISTEPDIDDDDFDHAAAMVLAGVAQGNTLRDRIDELGLDRNAEFDGRLIMATEDAEPIDMGHELQFTVAGPMQAELIKLQKEHDAWLKKQEAERKKKASLASFLASFSDTSIANLSSIVVVAEVEGKRMLLTGDARGDKILEGLELVGALKPGDRTMHVDILKMPHHGSDRNMDDAFFERISADHYVFSGDGEHGNPERETLEMLFRVHGTKDYMMHFTYPIAEIDEGREKDWNKERGKEQKRGTNVREEWSDQKHSLTELFKKHGLREGREYKVVGDEGGHVIDLLNPVGF